MNGSEETDIIVVGAGAAGSVIAARLSEDPNLNVTVIEAGKDDLHPYIHIPAGFIKMIFNENYIWPFKTEPTENTNGRQINVLQGRVVGGSSSLNGLIYNRGQPADFDGWAQMGNAGWDYESILPYFRRSETFDGKGDPKARGKDGPLQISELKWIHEICEAFISGAGEQDLARTKDYNGGDQEGVGYFQRIIKGRRRVSAARGYLKPALKRPNLRLITRAVAAKVLFDGNRAIGVEYITGEGRGERRVLKARRQVVLSSGTVNTARLLQLSGVGRQDDLERIGVPVVSERAGVGRNLRDHYSVRVVARARGSVTINEYAKAPRLWAQQMRWLFGLPSIITLSPSLVHIFAKSREGLETPDLQGVFSPASYKAGFVSMLDDYPGMTCGFWAHKPASTGYVHALSTNPIAEVKVQPNYLSVRSDLETLVSGIKLARKLVRSGPMQKYFDHEQLPGKDVQSDDELEAFAKQYGVSSWHLVGTAKMGPATDPDAVVDERLRVHGMERLTIADASVMPTSPSANTFAATIMIAEKASDMLKADLASNR
ncbi:MAG: choline dehydrogenase [Rhizobiales bacterium]|nr:choline dehydrogenase [Hyphomicrobiales bacterium]MBA68231.1 choline dehydrogenase [Hyphomicrobiales bacterium]|tara:strand:+ start:317 stop:1948 length:1632 start_codon:yes stop_codon:yes gene_type:complete